MLLHAIKYDGASRGVKCDRGHVYHSSTEE